MFWKMWTMSVNRGKQFEEVVKQAFLAVPHTSVDRLHDQMSGFKVTSKNVSDFIVYHKPHEYYIECKSVHGNVLPFSNITPHQWASLLEKSEIDGVIAGVIVWFVDRDVTYFVSIQQLQQAEGYGKKSVRYDDTFIKKVDIPGKKKRVFFDYDMSYFFKQIMDQH